MPIYEFFCKQCNTIFNFFSKTVNTSKIPPCPLCNKKLERRVSVFSFPTASKDEKGRLPISDEKLESMMGKLASEAERLNEEDPRQAANLMKKFTEMTGIKLGDGMKEALKRMEAGEDPEKIEEEMGDIMADEEPFLFDGETAGQSSKKQPKRDETLYDL